MRRLREASGALGLALGAACALLALLALGGVFSPALDALTHLAPLYLAGAALAAVLALGGLARTRLAGLGLAAVGAAAATSLILPEVLRDTGPSAPLGAPGEIKVIQFNAWLQNPDVAHVADWLKAENPDYVFVEEATPALRDAIMARTGWQVAGLTTSLIFSRQFYHTMQRPSTPDSALNWVNATYNTPTGQMELVVTHFNWPTSRAHQVQSHELPAVLAQLRRDRMVLGGDFNSTPWSFTRRRDDRAFGLIRRDRALWSWPTGRGAWRLPTPFPFMPLDHIYAGRGWATTSVRRGPQLGSDHYPLIVTLAPVAQP